MALRALIIGKKLTEARGRLEKLREKDEEFQTREAELEEAISEAESEEDQGAVEKIVEEFETEKEAHEEEKKKLEEHGFIRLPDWKDALGRYLKEIM